MSISGLNRRHARVLEEIFAHPLPHNLEWRDVVSLIAHLGSALERHDGKYDFRIGSASAVFTKPRHKDVGPDEIIELRRLFSDAGFDPQGAAVQKFRTVVLIDHHSVRFFEPSSSGSFEETKHIEPEDPHGFRRHLEHRKEAHYKGERVPETDALFYERVAERLTHAPSIVLIGDATGKSSAANYLLEYLKQKHKEIAERIVAVREADLSAITLKEIEETAR